MTWEAVLRFAPAYDTRHLVGDPPDAPDLLVSDSVLQKVKPNEPTPVLCDHDDERVVGHVKNVWVSPDVDYGTRIRRWHFAACELNERPSWLKRGGGVSWSYHPLHTYTAREGTTVLTSCILREVLLSPSLSPAEPLARVCLVKESPVARRHQAQTESKATYGHGQVLIRPGIGTVLGVR